MASTTPEQPTVLSILHDITSIKNEELTKQRDACRSLKTELLGPAESERDPVKRVRAIVQDAGIVQPSEQSSSSGTPSSPRGVKRRARRPTVMDRKVVSRQHQDVLELAGLSAPNVQRLIALSRFDSSLSGRSFEALEGQLRNALNAQEIKYEYATLFSRIVTERAAENSSTAMDVDEGEAVGREEMHEQRREWESIVFEPMPLNQNHISAQLEKLFSSPQARLALDQVRVEFQKICQELKQPNQLDTNAMRWIVRGLLNADLLSDAQAKTLREIADSPTYLNEIADVLNMRLVRIERWQWDVEAIPLEMRRQLNGKYRVFMHEELTQALLLFYVGSMFSFTAKHAFNEFQNSQGWRSRRFIERTDQQRHDYFVGSRSVRNQGQSINATVSELYRSSFFMSILPKNAVDGGKGYGDDALSETPHTESRSGTAIDTKHSLLRLLTAESLLSDALGEDFVALQTDFRWFGPSLSHDAIFAVLQFFGVDKDWVEFFERFLRAPLQFIHDGPKGASRVRQRGVPMSHALSEFFGESVMFCLDFAVNEATEGQPMFRLHDDVWFWGTEGDCELAWSALTGFAKTLGIEMNEEKTGAARMSRQRRRAMAPLSKNLPTHNGIKWGFLKIDSSTGTFVIDKEKLGEHVQEMRRQLAAQRSVLSWIKAYNSYTAFLLTHLVPPAPCFGMSHVESQLAALRAVHAALFPDTNGSVTDYLRQRLRSKFDLSPQMAIPDGFIYFPLMLGGLGLRNPFLELVACRASLELDYEDPSLHFEEAEEVDEVEYIRCKRIFEQSGPADRFALSGDGGGDGSGPNPMFGNQSLSQPTEFMTPEQWARFRRDGAEPYAKAFNELLQASPQQNVELTQATRALLAKLPKHLNRPSGQCGIAGDWDSMRPYWQSVVQAYGEEMGEVFGGLAVVEKALLPLGMVGLFGGKIRWES